MFDRGRDASELSNVLELVTDAWNYPSSRAEIRMKINNTFKLIIAIVVSELAGIIGSVFTTPSIAGWYAGIVKPTFNPPAWVFGPVWTTLFALMGIAAFLVWRKGLDRRDIKIALSIFLGLVILATIVAFYKISPPSSSIWTTAGHGKLAAWLLVPYILWVSFAAYLNYAIWSLN